MASINSVTLVGRVVRDLELKTTNSGKTVTSFALAVDGYSKDSEASFIDVVAWGKAAEILEQYAKKGKQIGITGRMQTRPWEDKEGKKRKATEVVVDQFQLLGGGEKGSAAPASERDGTIDAESANKPLDPTEYPEDKPIDLSEIPF